ncbi:MAG: flavodoxin family protein [Treponema sp.]|nr:flavodoxin family protein [Treponema sp.]
MKTAVIYYSEHHGNTKKLLDAIAKAGDVTLINASNNPDTYLSVYELIGFASGIYFSKFHDSVLQFARKNLPQGKKVFFIYTCGAKGKKYLNTIKQIAESKDSQILGDFSCPGFDSFGPFKLIGGIAKGRPNEKDMENAVSFFREICSEKNLKT